jgi:hypothetical protein
MSTKKAIVAIKERSILTQNVIIYFEIGVGEQCSFDEVVAIARKFYDPTLFYFLWVEFLERRFG